MHGRVTHACGNQDIIHMVPMVTCRTYRDRSAWSVSENNVDLVLLEPTKDNVFKTIFVKYFQNLGNFITCFEEYMIYRFLLLSSSDFNFFIVFI